MNNDARNGPEATTEAGSPLLASIEAAMMKTNDGDHAGALAECENAIRIAPDAAEPYFVMGIIAMICRDEGQALKMIEAAHRIDPDTREYAEALGVIHTRVGQLADGLYFSKLAMALEPHPLLSQRMPGMLRDLGAAFHSVSPSTHSIEAERLLNIAEYELARREAEAEVKLNPRSKNPYILLGRADHALRRYERAVGAYQAAIHLDPADGTATARLARTLVCLGRFAEAAACARHALGLAPADPEVYGAAMDALLRCPDVPLEDARALAHMHRALIAEATADEFAPPAEPGQGKLRVGLLSNAFFNTPAAQPVVTLFKTEPSRTIEYRGYAMSVAKDSTTANIRNRCAEWREIFDIDPFTLALTMRSERLDVLVDFSTPEWESRLGVAAMAPAPVRICVQALPEPGLAPGVTHVLSDETLAAVDRQTLAEGQAMIEVPGTLFACDPFDQIPQDLPAPASIKGGVTFGGMLDLSRLTAECARRWSEILLATNGSSLLLCSPTPPLNHVRARAVEMFSHYGAADRLLFPAEADEDEALPPGQRLPLAQWKAIDVFLDTVPFSGDRELAEALWAGIPVVSQMGSRRAGAIGASILAGARRVNWIAKDGADYHRIATELGSERAGLDRARGSLQSQVAGTLLFDTAGLARNIVAALEKLGSVARQDAGKTDG